MPIQILNLLDFTRERTFQGIKEDLIQNGDDATQVLETTLTSHCIKDLVLETNVSRREHDGFSLHASSLSLPGSNVYASKQEFGILRK